MNFLPDESTFNLAFLIIVAVLLLVLLVLLSTILKFISKWINNLRATETSGAQKIRQGAQIEANRLVEEARKRSIAIISDSTDITNATKDKIKKALDASSKELLEEYKKQTTSTLNMATRRIEKDLMEEVEDFKTTLHRETVGSQEEVEKKIGAEYNKIKIELEQYKKEQMKNIEENVYEILHDLSKTVLGKALNMEEHQELVIKSLEEAKRSKTFTQK